VSARTPGPWYADGGVIMPDGDTYQEGGETYGRAGDWREGIAQLVRNPADAAFIVTACNAHDELVAALKFCRDIAEEELPHARVGSGAEVALRHTIRKARAALAKVQL